MADNEYVAITSIRHGEDDGTVSEFAPGETIADVEDALLAVWWAEGSLAIKGSTRDPNTWGVTPDVYTTTPRTVEEALQVQAVELFGPRGKESDRYRGALTQPDDEGHDNPAGLLAGDEGVEAEPELVGSQVTQSDSTGTPVVPSAPAGEGDKSDDGSEEK
jgi:hypothetical protein